MPIRERERGEFGGLSRGMWSVVERLEVCVAERIVCRACA